MHWMEKVILGFLIIACFASPVMSQDDKSAKEEKPAPKKVPDLRSFDAMAKLQFEATAQSRADWGHWGNRPNGYNAWTNHSNRLIPVYVFGGSLQPYVGAQSRYRDEAKIRETYGRVPQNTLNPNADYCDQTDIYRLQRKAIEEGKKFVFLIVFDGMDWQTTWAAATYANSEVRYREGRGTGLAFQDYRGVATEFGYFVSSPYADDCEVDPNAQQIKIPWKLRGGYDANLGGDAPWVKPRDPDYLIGRSQLTPHAYTDSSSSATSLTAGIKTFNGAVNMTFDCKPVETIAHWAQREKQMAVGVCTSVPISHATPACAYSHNVSRDDYQDLTRDLLGLPSIVHRKVPLPGMDVVLGTGWGVNSKNDRTAQGENYIPGNRALAAEDRDRVSIQNGGRYVVAERTPGKVGREVLAMATKQAIEGHHRLLGFFGTDAGHLPFQTADGDYHPARDVKGTEVYTRADIVENPILAEMAQAAIDVLATNERGFWLMIESGDVDWANHANNIDSSIGAVLSGDNAFRTVVEWIESKNAWRESLVIVTADHGHYLNLLQPEAIAEAAKANKNKRHELSIAP